MLRFYIMLFIIIIIILTGKDDMLFIIRKGKKKKIHSHNVGCTVVLIRRATRKSSKW